MAIEDAKERDKLLCKAEEALKGSYILSLKLNKVVAQLPATILASTHKASLEKMDIVGKEQESQLRHISIHGALPGQSRFIGINELKNVLKPLPPLCLCKKVEKQENQKALLVIMENIGSVF